MTDLNGEDTDVATVSGIAALSLLEAIILTLQAKGLLSADEIDEALDAAISAHRNRHETHTDAENALAAQILTKLRVQGNSVRLDF